MSTASTRIIEQLHSQQKKTKTTGSDSWLAQCPAHEDNNPSLSIRQSRGQALVYCHAGCDTGSILSALNLNISDLYDNPRGVQYDYKHHGATVRQVTRTPEKQFYQNITDKTLTTLYSPQGLDDYSGKDVYVTEGEKDADSIELLVRDASSTTITAVSAPLGAGNWAKTDYTPLLVANTVTVVADKDKPGMKRAAELTKHLKELGVKSVYTVLPAEGKDASDHVAAGHSLSQFKEIDTSQIVEPRFQTITSIELADKQFPQLEYVIPGILPVGVSLLVAPPKVGKSWLCLQLAHAFATGGKMFGHIETGKPRPVLYLSLEDSERRLKSRLDLAEYSAHENLEFATGLQGLNIIELLTEWLSIHETESPLVIVDILGKVMPPTSGNQNQYLHETQVIGAMKAVIDEVNNAALILVHHTRKQGSEDFIDRASGTQGLVGAVDTILFVERERQQKRATLHVTSRDVEENEYSIVFTDLCQWVLDGSSIEEAKSSAVKARVEHNLGDLSQAVLTEISRHPEGISPLQLKELFPPEQAKNVKMTLQRLYERERINKLGRGVYVLPAYPPVTSVTSVTLPLESNESNESNTSLGLAS